ncbi:MAG: SRPBCC domain-containing protein [Chloroflexota bacterium]|nr:SRPBCC domain-containing protein [Chloroflexota bacterium]
MDLRTVRTIRSAIEIRAPLEVVWQVLTDFASYPEWNPHLRRVRGRPRQGRRITVRSQPPGARPMVFRPLVVTWAPPHELRWRAIFISDLLFSGEHGFRLEAVAPDRVRFVQDETFSGLLVPFYSRLRLPATRRGFEQMNQALRERAERLTQDQAAH